MTDIGFDAVWDFVPDITVKQMFLMVVTGIIAMQDGLITMYPIFALYEPKTYECIHDARYVSSFTPNTTVYEYNGLATACNSTCPISGSRQRRNSPINDDKSSSRDTDKCFYQHVEFSTTSTDNCTACFEFETYAKNIEKERQFWCKKFVYSDPYINDTIVTEHNLICSYQWLRETIFSLGNVGLAIGSFLGGSITDILGRKSVMFSITIITLISLVLQSLSSNIWAFTVFWTISKIGSQVKYLAYSSFTIEIISPKWRGFAGQMNHVYYACGCMLASVLSYFYKDWQSFTFAVVGMHLPLLSFWCIIPESPRWLFLKKRREKAEAALNQLLGDKYSDIHPSFFERMDRTEERILRTEALESSHAVMTSIGSIYHIRSSDPKTGITGILKYRQMRRVSAVVFVTFFVIAMVYMGISYNAAELPGNIWWNNGINGILDAVANIIGILLLAKCGRKTLLFWSLNLTGLAYMGSEIMLLINTIPRYNRLEISRWMAFIAKFFISGSFSIIYTYTAELFPTNVRTAGLGLGSLGGGLGGIIAPYILALQKPPVSIKWFPAAIFAIFCAFCSFFLLMLPETKGEPLYESIVEAEIAWSDKKDTAKQIKEKDIVLSSCE